MGRRNIYFLLFTLSGFSGLIYESIWTHYLKLFLGHAAYAQSLVLAIFMGGMAIGSWLCSRYTTRWKRLLLGYAVTEGIIGLCALVFHGAFVRVTELSYGSIIPELGTAAVVTVFKWTLSALMILPQSVLLGMTFPLMSAGVLRLYPDKPGRIVGMLYFTNSMGAAVGVLVSGFMLIRLVGLPGTIGVAGLINILLALSVWWLVRTGPAAAVPVEVVEVAPRGRDGRWYWMFLLASLVTGLASFIYEIGWIRMLSLVLGTSTHAFELMLSAFILGLALGGLWIQRRIDRVGSPVRYLAGVQVIMGFLALSTLLLYGNTFEVMQWLVKSLPKTDNGYTLFNLSSSGIAMAIMLPSTFCAGMTLPLITYVLLRGGQGEGSIGAVYAANTVGAIIGVFFSIHIGMPQLGLKGLITFGAGMDIALGVALFWSTAAGYENRGVPAAATAAGVAAVTAALLFVQLDPYKMGSGVYRQGNISSADTHRLLYHKDGKTATVSCFLSNAGVLSIRTNGKPDAAMTIVPGRESQPDEYTMILLGLMPMLFHPEARTTAAIGLGSGMTSHTLLCNPAIRQVDTVEIEKAMIGGANSFRPRVELVYTDPRSRIYIDDAKTFFSTYNRKYDIIVSEPSNPWVSGVAGLFSDEFYRLIKRHLNERGLFVQWIQLYEINIDLVVSVLKAVSVNFSDFAVYATNDGDIMIIATEHGLLREPDYSVLKLPSLAEALRRIHIEGEQDIAVRKIGTKKFLGAFLKSFPVRTNSDYYPVLDQSAARSRFLGESARELVGFSHVPVPALEMLGGSPPRREATNVTFSKHFFKAQETVTAMALRDFFQTGMFSPRDIPEDLKRQAILLKKGCAGTTAVEPDERLASAFTLSVVMTPYLSPAELSPFWHMLGSGVCSTAPFPVEKLWYDLFKAAGRRDGAGMLQGARALLTSQQYLTSSGSKYLLASGMVGALAQGETSEAHRLWTTYGLSIIPKNDPDLLFRLLAAESTKQ